MKQQPRTAPSSRTVRPARTAPTAAISPQRVQEVCAAAGCVLPEEVCPHVQEYLELLMRWNKVMNLVGARSWRDALENLLMDSFHLARFLEKLPLPAEPSSWDLGAGAGLPGIPLRMVWTRGQYTLVEAREKRALFLSTVTARLGLARTDVFRGRAEAFFAMADRPADMVVSRAFLPWREVLTLIAPAVAGDALAVFLTLEPLPAAADMPEGWCAVAEEAYRVDGDTRFFWALRRCAA